MTLSKEEVVAYGPSRKKFQRYGFSLTGNCGKDVNKGMFLEKFGDP